MKVQSEFSSFGGGSHSFRLPKRYCAALLGYFNHEADLRGYFFKEKGVEKEVTGLIKQNNLQIGDRIRRKYENDRLARYVLPGISLILLGSFTDDSQLLQKRIRTGRRLRRRFEDLLEGHRKNVDLQFKSQKEMTGRKNHRSFRESAAA
jgi:hypothetical protein